MDIITFSFLVMGMICTYYGIQIVLYVVSFVVIQYKKERKVLQSLKVLKKW